MNRINSRLTAALLIAALAITLTACGGGGFPNISPSGSTRGATTTDAESSESPYASTSMPTTPSQSASPSPKPSTTQITQTPDNGGGGAGGSVETPQNSQLIGNHPGNTANLGWVYEKAPNSIYIGTEYGLSRVNASGEVYDYLPYNTYGLIDCGKYLIFSRTSSSGGELYGCDIWSPDEMNFMPLLYNGITGKTILSNGYLYFSSREGLTRAYLGGDMDLYDLADEFIAETVIGGAGHGSSESFPFTFSGNWTIWQDYLFYEMSREGYRRENYWNLKNTGDASVSGGGYLTDVDLQGMFALGGCLFFIPYLPYGSQAPWEEITPGIYMIKDEGPIIIPDSGGDVFPAECLLEGRIRNFNIMGDILVCGGDLGDGAGLYTVDISAGATAKIFDGNVYFPNTTSEYIWFRTMKERVEDGIRYDYWRIRYDGSDLRKLDYERDRW